MEHHKESQRTEDFQLGSTEEKVIVTHKPLFNRPQVLRDVSEGIQPAFSPTYFRDLPQDSKIRFLPNDDYGWPKFGNERFC